MPRSPLLVCDSRITNEVSHCSLASLAVLTQLPVNCSKPTPYVLRLGAFHTFCAFLASIGKWFGDAGLRELLIENGVVGPSAVEGVLCGKSYNRALGIAYTNSCLRR